MRTPEARRARPAVVLAVLVVLGFYGWTTLTSVSPTIHQTQFSFEDQYNALGDAFAHGQLDLRIEPPPGLRALADPLDPASNLAFRVAPYNDLSLYHGRFYAYWGPAPALLLFGPAHLLGLSSFPVELATFLFTTLAFLAAVGLLRLAVRRWAPGAPAWAQALAVVVVGAANAGTYLLRLPETHQAAVAAGAGFQMLALYLLARAIGSAKHRLGLLTAASACVALAIGSRATLVPVALVPVGVLLAMTRRKAGGRMVALALLGPLVLGAAALLAYDAARFGSPLETGLTYQFGSVDWKAVGSFHPEAIVDGLRYHLLRGVLVRPQFPFFWLNPVEIAPFRFLYTEPMAGVLFTSPVVVLAGLAALGRARSPAALKVVVAAAVALAAALVVELSSFPSIAMRFTADYVSLLVLAALVAWLAVLGGGRTRRRTRRGAATIGTALAAWTLVVNVALSLTTARVLPSLHPATLAAMESVFLPLPEAASAIIGRPLLAGVDHDPRLPSSRPGEPDTPYGLSDLHALTVRVFAPSAERARMQAVIAPVPGDEGKARRTVRVRSAEGLTVTVPTQRGRFSVPIALRRGLNAIRIETVGARDPDPERFHLSEFALLR